jgi:hypothetical protein
MKLRNHFHAIAVLVALAAPAVVNADTVFYSSNDGTGIKSVSGTITKETQSELEITTFDGRTISLSRDEVYQVIRDKKSTTGESPFDDPRPSKKPRNDHYGIKGGMNMSNLSTDPAGLEDADTLQSFALGIWYGRPLNRQFSLLAEGLYSVKGDAESGDEYDVSTKVSYLDIPVLAKMGFMHGGPIQPSVFLGPSMALNLSAKSRFEGEGSEIEVDVKDQMNTFDLGLVVGGGVEFPVGKRSFGVELRYSKGLTNAVDENANGDAHNNVLAVMGSFALQ